MKSEDSLTFFQPIADVGGTTGYAGISAISDPSKVAKVASKYLADSLLLNKLTKRVHELLLEDMRYQRERVNNYGQHRWL
ncbi:hypothetical protein [Anabaena subtropica]|uniref:Uncharacterized protein n=1 Tax=Anabaena subtropica FACHB-260 TaxID=2692884 RepID=A0ABR8CLZ4_9NOST|nr:hypothetical protein [Anabaena subtropica]MBD2343796.1 hypothetical protein [Anabaena subtropica FACHB-260]